jgi:hypothetical protein
MHGTVYWGKDALNQALLPPPGEPISDFIGPLLWSNDAVTWMDTSTSERVRAMEAKVGWERVSRISG